MISWLTQPETLKALPSLALTAMSTVVAAVALFVSYRQSVGWKPIVLVSQTTMQGGDPVGRRSFRIVLELWNRRKYPLAVRGVSTKISGFVVLDQSSKERNPEVALVQRNSLYLKAETVVEPQGHAPFVLEVHFDEQSIDAMRPQFDVTVTYFDPHRNKLRNHELSHRLFYPQLGWKLSEDEREKARFDYRQYKSFSASVGLPSLSPKTRKR